MVPVRPAPFCEGFLLGIVGVRTEHQRPVAVLGHALAFQVGDVRREGCRAKGAAAMAYDASLDQDATRGIEETGAGERNASPAAKGGRPALPGSAPRRASPNVPGLLGRFEHLGDERLRLRAAIADAAQPNAQIIVANVHDGHIRDSSASDRIVLFDLWPQRGTSTERRRAERRAVARAWRATRQAFYLALLRSPAPTAATFPSRVRIFATNCDKPRSRSLPLLMR